MKKSLFLSLLTLMAFTAKHTSAQTFVRPSKDSLLNADTAYAYIPVSGYTSVIGIQPVYTKKSGTPAGNIIIDKTIDGISYVALDTLAISNASPNVFGLNANSKVFEYEATTATKYRVRFINSGTGAGYIKVYYTLRR